MVLQHTPPLKGEVDRRSRDGGVDIKLKNLNDPSVTYGDSSPFQGSHKHTPPLKRGGNRASGGGVNINKQKLQQRKRV